MPSLSELEAVAALTDYRLRKYLLELIEYKRQINEELEKEEDISPQRQMDLEAAKNFYDQQIQFARFEGIL